MMEPEARVLFILCFMIFLLSLLVLGSLKCGYLRSFDSKTEDHCVNLTKDTAENGKNQIKNDTFSNIFSDNRSTMS